MSQQISFSGWISQIPNQIVASWIKKEFIPDDKVLAFSRVGDEDNRGKHGDILRRMTLSDTKGYMKDFKWVKTNREGIKYRNLGYEFDGVFVRLIDTKVYDKMHSMVSRWYRKVFDYVEAWLRETGLLQLKRGNIQTGFCVESDPDHEVVKKWNAPLADKGNKVVQVKEKFGRIVVYFGGLTKSDRKKVDMFAAEVALKFDCVPDFF